MRFRFHLSKSATTTVQTNAPEPNAGAAAPARPQVPRENSASPAQGARTKKRPLSSYFSACTQASPSAPANSSDRLASKEQEKQLSARIDEWVRTQDSSSAVNAGKDLKLALLTGSGSGSANTILQFIHRTSELNLQAQRLTSIPPEIGRAKNLKCIFLNYNRLTSIPAEIGDCKSLEQLSLSQNRLTSLPSEIHKAEALKGLGLRDNQLTSFPVEMGQSKALQYLDLSKNRLTSFPAEMGQVKTLKNLFLSNNQLTTFPVEMSQATALKRLGLQGNRLTELPDEIAQLSKLKVLDLKFNRFTQLPLALLELPAKTKIDLTNNPMPDEQIIAAHAAIEQRRNAGLTVPRVKLPPLAQAADLRAAVAQGMNVHQEVLSYAFQRRVAEVALQFPHQLKGGIEEQRAQLKTIKTRLVAALDAHEQHHASKADTLSKARSTMNLMFQKSLGQEREYFNDFQYSPGHVLAYAFLSLETQCAATPDLHQAQARYNGMTRLIGALRNGNGHCDTRLSGEVMQIIGLPLSEYAQAHPGVVTVSAASPSEEQSYEFIFSQAKKALHAEFDAHPELTDDHPPENWRNAVKTALRQDHPNILPDHVEKYIAQFEADWSSFHEIAMNASRIDS